MQTVQAMYIIAACLALALAAPPAAKEGFCRGVTCEAPRHSDSVGVGMQGISLLQSHLRSAEAYHEHLAAAPENEAAKEDAKTAKDDAKDGATDDAKDESKEEAKSDDPANGTSVTNTSSNANETENATANATANASANATVPAGCATKNDPRATGWFAETAPEGTPCVFGIDTRDEGSHCIFENGDYGSNGFCFTKSDSSEWGSCNAECPLYGQSAALGKKLDTIHKQVKSVKKALNGGSNEDAEEGAAKDDDADKAPKTKTKDTPKEGKKKKTKATAKEGKKEDAKAK